MTTAMRPLRKSMLGASMVEAMIALPIILVACLLVLQITLLYRAKIALNYATQEGARIGSMSNARVVPRFLTDLASFSVTGNGKKGGNPVSASAIPGASASSDGVRPSGAAFEAASAGSNSKAKAPPELPKKKLSAGADEKQGKEFLKSLGKGLLRYGDSSVLQGFIAGITPFYVSGTKFKDVVKGQLAAYADAMMNSCILYHNPTQSAFIDFGFMEVEGPDKMVFQIPSDLMRYRIPGDVDPSGKGINYFKKKGEYLDADMKGIRDGLSTMSVQDANLLSIEIKYSAPMKVPIAREIIIGITKLYNSLKSGETALGKSFVKTALDKGRWPMEAYATYRMRSPVHWHIFYPFGDVSNVRSTQIEAFDGIQGLWNLVVGSMAPSKDGESLKWDPAEPQIGFCPGLAIDALSKLNPSESWVGKDYDEMLAKCVKAGNCP
jgi:hypothetical protein